MKRFSLKKIEIDLLHEFISLIKNNKHKFSLMGLVVLISGLTISSVPLFLRYFLDHYIAKKSMDGINNTILFFIILIFVAVSSIYLFYVVGGEIEYKLGHDLREKAFMKVQRLSLGYFDTNNSGEVLSRLTSDIAKLSEIFSWGIIDLSYNLVILVISLTALLLLNAKLTFMFLLIGIPIGLFGSYFQKKLLYAQRSVRLYNSRLFSKISEGINGAKVIKSLGIEEMNFNEYVETTNSMRVASIRSFKLSSIFVPLVMFIGSIAAAVALGLSSKMVVNNTMSFGTFVAFLTFCIQLFDPIRVIARVMGDIKSGEASAERVFELFDEVEEISDSNEIIEKYGDIFNPNSNLLPNMIGKIEFKNVSFSYNGDQNILENISFAISPGESIGIVGSTGSGKSTIINLLCRFYEPTSGKILIDGKDYRDFPKAFIYNNLGYVLQFPYLFSGSIKHNILLGKENATDDEVISSLKSVGIYDFVKSLPQGMDTTIGDSHGSMSTGQKQLLSFARAIIKDPKLLILDEATSSIDTQTEKTLQNAVDVLIKGKTTIIIAHRLSTIKNVDRILFIENGQIIESGSHSQLIEKKGYYYRMYTNQFLEGNFNNL